MFLKYTKKHSLPCLTTSSNHLGTKVYPWNLRILQQSLCFITKHFIHMRTKIYLCLRHCLRLLRFCKTKESTAYFFFIDPDGRGYDEEWWKEIKRWERNNFTTMTLKFFFSFIHIDCMSKSELLDEVRERKKILNCINDSERARKKEKGRNRTERSGALIQNRKKPGRKRTENGTGGWFLNGSYFFSANFFSIQ